MTEIIQIKPITTIRDLHYTKSEYFGGILYVSMWSREVFIRVYNWFDNNSSSDNYNRRRELFVNIIVDDDNNNSYYGFEFWFDMINKKRRLL